MSEIDKPENLFHKIALIEYVYAMFEGKENDSEYVRQKAYDRYEKELRNEKLP